MQAFMTRCQEAEEQALEWVTKQGAEHYYESPECMAGGVGAVEFAYITERVMECVDTNGNKTTTTDRTIHRKGDYERNATYEAQLKHHEEIISRMQQTIDSLALGNSLNVATHLAKKDSTNVTKEKNTKNIKSMSEWWNLALLVFSVSSLVLCFLPRLIVKRIKK